MTKSPRFQKLMESGYIGSVRTRNRILKTGAQPGFYDYIAGYVPQKIKDYYEVLARGGVGLIVVGSAEFDLPTDVEPKGYSIKDDKYIASLNGLAQVIHKYGCPAFIQMFHMGPMRPSYIPGPQPAGSSSPPKSKLPVLRPAVAGELTTAEIEEMVEKLASAAVRVRKAGFEGIELNAARKHLLNSFLSRAWNKRQDEYGVGSLESRTKILVDIIQEVKRRNGKDFAIIVLINGAELGLDSGLTPEESQGIAKILEAAGADAIHVRAEFYTQSEDPMLGSSTHFPDMALYPEAPYPLGKGIDGSRHGAGATVPLTGSIKKAVSIPVIAVGRLAPELGEKILRHGMADFIGLNRRLMADPELPNKIASGKVEDITPCTGCMTCFDALAHVQPPRCQVNAALGKEKEYEIKSAPKKKRVLIVGGGPAGMEAARVAALRGHEVILYEKERKLGGSMLLAAVVKGFDRGDILSLVRYLKTQLTKLGVDIRLGKEVSRSVIEEVKPDVLIVATGGVHNIPELPGINKRNVVTSRDLHHRFRRYLKFFGPRLLRRLTKFWMPLGKRVVIMGGNNYGCQIAEFLVKQGRKVTIVDTAKEIGDGLLESFIKPFLLMWLEEKGMPMMTEVKYEEITDVGLTITTKEGKRQTIEANTIVTALPLLPNTELLKSLGGIVPEVYTIGDCEEPRLIADAIADGSRIARTI